MRPVNRAVLTLLAFLMPIAMSARLMKEPLIQTRDSTISVDRAKLKLGSLQYPVSVEEQSDKTGTSISIRPEGGFGYLVRIDRMTIGKHPFARSTQTVDESYLRNELAQLRVITYSQKGIKKLGTTKEEQTTIDGNTALIAIDKMSVDVPQMFVPKLYRGFLLFASNGSLAIIHYESPSGRDDPTESYVSQLESIFRAIAIRTLKEQQPEVGPRT